MYIMKTGTWVLVAIAVLALVLFMKHRKEGYKEKKDKEKKKRSKAQKERDAQDAKGKRFGSDCPKGKFWNRTRGKCMSNKNCKGTVEGGWCYRTKNGKRIADEEFDKIAEKGKTKCKPGQTWDYYKDKCVGLSNKDKLVLANASTDIALAVYNVAKLEQQRKQMEQQVENAKKVQQAAGMIYAVHQVHQAAKQQREAQQQQQGSAPQPANAAGSSWLDMWAK